MSNKIDKILAEISAGELFDKIVDQGYFDEDYARKIFKQIAKGLYYLHINNICHRDLKPENFLMLNGSNDSIKIIDFGLS